MAPLSSYLAKQRTVFTASRRQNSPCALTPLTSLVSRNRLHLPTEMLVFGCFWMFWWFQQLCPMGHVFNFHLLTDGHSFHLHFLTLQTLHVLAILTLFITFHPYNSLSLRAPSRPAQTILAQDQPLRHNCTSKRWQIDLIMPQIGMETRSMQGVLGLVNVYTIHIYIYICIAHTITDIPTHGMYALWCIYHVSV